MSDLLTPALAAALAERAGLIQQLTAENTNAYRLFHGATEGQPGLTVDRYGDIALVQTFHRSLEPAELADLVAFYLAAQPGLLVVYNDRSQSNSRVGNWLSSAAQQQAEQPRQIAELGVHYAFAARHPGQDPWLFLDLRAGRRRVLQLARGKSVLNLFAYTCGIGTAAATAGARQVVNVDFAQSSLAIGKQNAELNGLLTLPSFLKSDAFTALRQYAGLGQPQTVRGRRLPEFAKLAPQQFDLVFLDPPRHAKSPFGVVDLVRDYAALLKPALLATAPGGTLLCCNNAAELPRDVWLDQVQRCAVKAGRPIREWQWIAPEADFPSPDGQPPLKILELQV